MLSTISINWNFVAKSLKSSFNFFFLIFVMPKNRVDQNNISPDRYRKSAFLFLPLLYTGRILIDLRVSPKYDICKAVQWFYDHINTFIIDLFTICYVNTFCTSKKYFLNKINCVMFLMNEIGKKITTKCCKGNTFAKICCYH